MKRLMIINGVARVGKNSFVDIVSMWFKTNDPDVVVHDISSVDQVRKAADLLGWDQIKDDKCRKFLSDLKILSSEAYDGPFKYMTSCIDNAYENDILFFHIREKDEIAKFIKHYPDTKSILIVNDRVTIPNNMADQGVNDYKDYTFTVYNNSSLEDYVTTVIAWLKDNLINH